MYVRVFQRAMVRVFQRIVVGPVRVFQRAVTF
jgi:ribosomal protein S28E/S33